MAYKISRAQMENHVNTIAREVGRDLHLTTWSPGDGWTRYRIIEVEDQTTGAERNVTPYYNKQEISAFIDGLLTAHSAGFRKRGEE